MACSVRTQRTALYVMSSLLFLSYAVVLASGKILASTAAARRCALKHAEQPGRAYPKPTPRAH